MKQLLLLVAVVLTGWSSSSGASILFPFMHFDIIPEKKAAMQRMACVKEMREHHERPALSQARLSPEKFCNDCESILAQDDTIISGLTGAMFVSNFCQQLKASETETMSLVITEEACASLVDDEEKSICIDRCGAKVTEADVNRCVAEISNNATGVADEETVSCQQASNADALKAKAYEAKNVCGRNKQRSVSCCQSPTTCLGGDGTAENTMEVMGLTQLVLQIKAQRKGIKAVCNLNEDIAKLGLGISGFTLSYCVEQKASCLSVCEESISTIEQLAQDCLNNCANKDQLAICEKIEKMAISSNNLKNACSIEISQARSAATFSAIQSGLGLELAEDCQDAVANQNPIKDLNAQPPINIAIKDCSVKENKGMAHCLTKFCTDSANAKDVLCGYQKITDSGGYTEGGKSSGPGSSEGGGEFDDSAAAALALSKLDDDNVTQRPIANPIAAKGVSVNPSQSGSGGSLGFGPSGGDGQSLGRNKKKTVAKEKNYKILSGYQKGRFQSRGSGYTRRGVSSSLSSSNGKSKRKQFSIKNLKKYLPSNRSLASNRRRKNLNSSQIAGAHKNIWKQVHRRYISICKSKNLQGCK